MPREFVVSGWLVQPSLNRLSRDGTVVRLEPKVMQVLVCLGESPADVVTREALIARVWPDVFVTDDVLHRAVRELRRVFGDDAARPTYIETIRKRGYRLIAPVSEPPAVARDERPAAQEQRAGGEAGERPAPTGPHRPLTPLTGVAAALLALACAVAIALLVGRSETATQAHPRFVALTGGGLNETDPAIAPDGRRVAFVRRDSSDITAQADLFVLSTVGGTPERLTFTEADERMPVWSPDGRRLAFLRVDASRCDVVVRSSADGAERMVMPCPNRSESKLAWTSDGGSLVYSKAEPGAAAQNWRIAVRSLATGVERLLTSASPGIPGDHSPAVSPDGRTVAFIRQTSGGIADIFVIPLAGGAERRVTYEDADIEGMTWTDNGRAIVFSSDRAGGYTLWRLPAEGGALQFVAGGALRLKNPVASPRGDRIAYENWAYDINVWSAAADGSERRVTGTSDLWNYFPQISPDGERIVYVSTASGEQELWIARRDGSEPRQLTRLAQLTRQDSSRGAALRMPRWSADGRAVAVVAHTGARSDIFVVDAVTGALNRLTNDADLEAAPSWSADGTVIYAAVRTRGQWDVWALPLADADSVEGPRVAIPGGYAAQTASDGTIFFTYADRPGLWRTGPGDGDPVRVLADVSAADSSNWCVTARGVFRVTVQDGTPAVEQLDFDGRPLGRVGALTQMTWPGISVTPDGREVLYARWERRQSRIMLLETTR